MPLDRVLQPPDTIARRMEGEARLVELALQEPRSDAQFQATAREDVQGGCLLRKDRRVPEPIAEGERAHAHPRRDGRDRGQGSQGSQLMGGKDLRQGGRGSGASSSRRPGLGAL